MNHSFNRRDFLTLGGAVLTAAAAGNLPLAAAEPAPGQAGSSTWDELPVRGLLLGVPHSADVPLFCRFIREVLPQEGVNTLVLGVEYQYQFESHPELADTSALSRTEMKQIARACKDADIKLVLSTNLFAHQSDKDRILPLLANYPQFDESPDYNPPHPWVSGGEFGFYTKSLCPLHPDLHKVIFSLMDELIEVCETDSFHVGFDELWIIAYPKCPRCGGRDPAELFAGHATALRNHLAAKNCRMWMWGDRLIDGKTTNINRYEASMNNTWRAIDMVPKDILICDWQYEDAPPTPAYFAIKGFDVLACSLDKADVALAQLDMMRLIRRNATRAGNFKTIPTRMQGMLETAWMDAGAFIRLYQSNNGGANIATFRTLFKAIRNNSSQS